MEFFGLALEQVVKQVEVDVGKLGLKCSLEAFPSEDDTAFGCLVLVVKIFLRLQKCKKSFLVEP